ncbi:molecular chaperone [Iodobacter sp. HSC-16F04]|uniref:Molecular chaperone n=1 Tax=Iodobacter violaceini TaxID=3044271 RepID=A0ABX0KP27_9NEIS|nr:fimbria/pilus periplasmic chaperone [Iodobacter violacea]NHQ85491.1 molecular chaperone [Iodobacter violacea]
MQKLLMLLLAGWISLLCAPVFAAQFSVSPVRLDFTAKDKTSSITIANVGDTPLRVALDAKRWEQGAAGEDLYSETSDLLFFPKQAEIAPHSQRVVRIGLRVPRAADELAYRLYVNEQPPLKSEAGSSQLSMVLSFGVPIFVQPAALNRAAATMENIKLQKGDLSFTLKNTGNATLRLSSLKSETLKLDQQEFSAWYLLAGSEREYHFPLAHCTPGQHLIYVAFDRHSLSVPFNIAATACK